ncbi:MAG: hypothetical protein V4587_00260 [Acidobacteriota bacterium]
MKHELMERSPVALLPEISSARRTPEELCDEAGGDPTSVHTEQPHFYTSNARDSLDNYQTCGSEHFDDWSFSLWRGSSPWFDGEFEGFERTPLICVSLASGKGCDGIAEILKHQRFIYFDDKESWRTAYRLARLLLKRQTINLLDLGRFWFPYLAGVTDLGVTEIYTWPRKTAQQ